MSRHDPPTPADAHRRRLTTFSRWLTAVSDSPEAYREAIVALARRIDLGGLSKAETLATLDAIDELLADVWDKRPEEE